MTELIDIPSDMDTPKDSPPPSVEDFDPEYPGSTPDAPYGFKPDGTPYKRRPGKRGSGGSGRGNMPASNAQATQAAALLGRANLLMAMMLGFAGLPNTSAKIVESNGDFENMARDALLTDPALCRKILSAGGVSGKTGLAMAYVMLGGSVFSTAKSEIREVRMRESEADDVDYS